MKIYLDLVIPFLAIFILIIGRWWFLKSRKRALRKYDPNNDKAKLGEQARANGTAAVTEAELSSIGLAQPEVKRVLPTTSTDLPGENINGTGKTSPSNGTTPKPRRRFRNPFRRRRSA